MQRRTRALLEGGAVLVATAVVAVVVAREAPDVIPAQVTLTEAPVLGTTQLKLVIRGAGCAPFEDGRPAKKVRERVEKPRLMYGKDSITVTVQIQDPGLDACPPGEDPGVPYTLTLPTPVGERKILDGTQDPPVPFFP